MMSLDVYLEMPEATQGEETIFIRRNGANVAITREDWDALYPLREPMVIEPSESKEVYWANITHNLGAMADAAGLYGALWRPDENGMLKARDLIEPLRSGLARLKNNPDELRKFNPPNGWGDYDGLVHFVEKYLSACEAFQDADVRVSR